MRDDQKQGPQASAIPGFATARLWKYIFHSTTTSCARIHFLGPLPEGAECPAVTNGGTARDHSPINATASFARSRFISSVFVQRRRLARGACVTMTGKFPLYIRPELFQDVARHIEI